MPKGVLTININREKKYGYQIRNTYPSIRTTRAHIYMVFRYIFV